MAVGASVTGEHATHVCRAGVGQVCFLLFDALADGVEYAPHCCIGRLERDALHFLKLRDRVVPVCVLARCPVVKLQVLFVGHVSEFVVVAFGIEVSAYYHGQIGRRIGGVSGLVPFELVTRPLAGSGGSVVAEIRAGGFVRVCR